MSASPLIADASAIGRHAIEVRPVTSRRERDEFVRFPWQVYRDDPAWAPPLLLERKAFLDARSHPFYRHGAAALFLARRAGRIVGRIMASDDPRYNAEHAANVGCFGMFESIDDAEVAHGLLRAAERWLAGRGRTELLGPIDYSTNYSCGLLIDGFDTPARVMMNHNPPYYAGLLESCGLKKAKDLYSWWFDDPYDMGSKWRRRAARLTQRSTVVRALGRREIRREVMRYKSIYNEAWRRHWGFVQMTDAEFAYYGDLLAQIAEPELLLVAEVDGKPVGFSITLPDLNEAMAPLNGRLTQWGLPIGWLRLRQNLRRIKTARLITLGILEPYRRRGIAEMLILRTLDQGKNVLGYTAAELGWTLEDNDPINRTIEAVGGRRYKTYRIYEKHVAG